MSNWVRIDDKWSLRNPHRRKGQRVYGWEGKKWPRISVSVSVTEGDLARDASDPVTYPAATIYCQRKASAGEWWYQADMPVEFVAFLPELLAEVRP